MASAVLVRCDHLEVGYAGRPVLPPITLDLHAGEFWAVIGRNGAGKSTWFKTLLGLLPAVSGSVDWPSGPIPVSYVPQRSNFDEVYPVSARRVVAMGADRGWSFLRPRWREPDRVAEALDVTGASELADRTFRSLSEGQKQRVLLARIVASGARLVLLDEPTATMDVVAERESLLVLDGLRRRYGMAVVVVSHYLGVARDFADRVVLLDRDTGSVVAGTPDEVLGHDVFVARYGAEGARRVHD